MAVADLTGLAAMASRCFYARISFVGPFCCFDFIGLYFVCFYVKRIRGCLNFNLTMVISM
jgi:hypothetical protein